MRSPVRERVQAMLAKVAEPESVTSLLQILKGVVAGTVAWWLSVYVLSSQLPFLAPWTALLTVHATVYRSLARGVQTTIASTIGVAMSFAIGAWLGVSVWTFALALLIGLLGARVSWIRDEGVAIATTAIFVLGSGFGAQQPFLLDRILEVGLGVVVGIAVNLMLIPPLRDRQAARYVDSINRRMGELLTDIADGFSAAGGTERADAWVEETTSMSGELSTAWQMVHFARESERANPRPRFRRVRAGGIRSAREIPSDEASYENILSRVEEGISHLRHLARTLREGAYAEGDWDTNFREKWVAIARDAGRSIADPDAEVEPVADRLSALAVDLADNTVLPRHSWPLYGSLISSMQHLTVIVDDVASARAAREGGTENPEG
ncbi:aromatic acid exporter family protein [Brachybacterium sp. FME24]|uniref:FUSC family protein n=1 Tax=Brachybacterium sp. FME24 TaxID=2742605 RepID=UPI0018687810|nr:aromatic acid exporter family protein [Brachybacterium sp. FME24]